jgi:hypothetical protein
LVIADQQIEILIKAHHCANNHFFSRPLSFIIV